MIPTLFDEVIALARTTDPQTSHDAAKTVRVTDGQMAVYSEFRMYGPMTDEHCLLYTSDAADE